MQKSTNTSVARENIKVVKDYQLVDAGYHLSTRANILIGYLIGQIDSMGQKDILPYELTYSEVREIININGVRRISKRADVPKIMEELNSKPIYFQEFEQGEVITDNWITWISSLKYNRKKDIFTFVITKELHEFLLKLGVDPDTGETRPFIAYAWLLSTTFRCDYSIVFYEQIVKRIRNDKTVRFEMTLDKIRFNCLLGDKYSKFYDLKRFVIEPSIKDINNSHFSLFNVSYEVGKKKGKAVLSVIFHISRKKAQKLLAKAPVESFYLKIDELTGLWKTKPSKEFIDKLIGEGVTSNQMLTAIATTNNKIESGITLKSSELAYFRGVLSNLMKQGEFFVDPIQEAKEKKKAKGAKRESLRREKEEVKAKIHELQKKREKVRSSAWQNISFEEKERVFNIVKEKNPTLRTEGKSIKENLTNPMVKAFVVSQFQREGLQPLLDILPISESIEALKRKL